MRWVIQLIFFFFFEEFAEWEWKKQPKLSIPSIFMFLLFFSAVMWLIDVVMVAVAVVMPENSRCISSLYIDKWILWLKKKSLCEFSYCCQRQSPPLGWSLVKVILNPHFSICASEKLHDQVLMPGACNAGFSWCCFSLFSCTKSSRDSFLWFDCLKGSIYTSNFVCPNRHNSSKVRRYHFYV